MKQPPLLLLWLCAAGCAGTEGDLLLRTLPDLAAPAPQADSGDGFACQTGTQSGTCKAEAEWATAADKDCQTGGLALHSYTVTKECGKGSYTNVAFVCCPREIVMGCVKENLGAPASPECHDAGTWKTLAAETCMASGYVLAGLMLLYPGAPCGPTEYGGAASVCCPGSAERPTFREPLWLSRPTGRKRR